MNEKDWSSLNSERIPTNNASIYITNLLSCGIDLTSRHFFLINIKYFVAVYEKYYYKYTFYLLILPIKFATIWAMKYDDWITVYRRLIWQQTLSRRPYILDKSLHTIVAWTVDFLLRHLSHIYLL